MDRSLRLKRLASIQNNRCYYCNGKMAKGRRFANSGAGPSIERLVCGHDGGTYERANTVASCRGCNSARPLIDAVTYRELRVKLLRKGWAACSFPPKEILKELKQRYGYHTGLIEFKLDDIIVMC